ncbi:MAG: BrnA antitoxin family protein [Acidobacteriota bacterium]|nr:BrnA antitoxin family protein [Acidobacteriota bacterium]
MTENKKKNLPEFDSLDDLVNFFDENDFGDFDEKLKEFHFDVDLKSKKHLIGIDEKISKTLAKIATQENTTTELLVNSWLKEKVSGYVEVK